MTKALEVAFGAVWLLWVILLVLSLAGRPWRHASKLKSAGMVLILTAMLIHFIPYAWPFPLSLIIVASFMLTGIVCVIRASARPPGRARGGRRPLGAARQ